MTKLEVEVVSTETIKPSSPTPDHLRRHKLSFLDQIQPPIFMVKQSLSKTLTQYYPLAGRVIENAYVDCNDQGAPYVQARVRSPLSDVISQPEPNQLNQLLPCELDNVGDLVLAVQVNVFDCGGMAIGVCISHKVADALSLIMFLNSWASISRGDCNIKNSTVNPPIFDLATHFPPRSISGFKPSTGITREKIVTKRFVFSASTVASLRSKYTDNKNNERKPTRIEALSAFIWARVIASTQGKPNPNTLYKVLHAVNLRTRMDPPLPEYHFGNVSRFAMSSPSFDEGEDMCCGMVGQMREAIKTINGDYIAKIKDGNAHLKFLKQRAEEFMKGEVASFSFTSLCRFPLYETDFGWSKPVWVASASLTFKNLVVFMDAGPGSSGGIEVWVNLKEEDMAKFQDDEQLLASCHKTFHKTYLVYNVLTSGILVSRGVQ
ncbi:vinorine synthase-like [Pyrus ussuriensis x Pyrus communis]|uniref:Vinorine synthase-like n=1 Tax=Pyrus ussuriensis x Pyrus communis TaxID=2448454 RepID=A0A5N5HG07_9ROSA|nr:vinorine synthase-like [Pyrus ussuriensis x Pyrus communis]KAB2626795.1 vinorine synthase-like [Pyrus ussuriensis x Pyrus communis]